MPCHWGDNGYGQTITPASAQTRVTQVACGGYHTYALAPHWSDCNSNGIFDGDDVTSGGMSDLDGNGVPDTCQGVIEYNDTSPNLGVPTANIAVNYKFTLPARAEVDVVLQIHAIGDFDASTEYLTVKLNGVTNKRLFEVGGVNCLGGTVNNGTVTIPKDTFNAFVAAGSLLVTLLPSPAVTGSECGNGSMTVEMRYTGIGPDGDCNNNGRLDVREMGENPLLDRNHNGRIDACEISDDPSRDCNLNGLIDSYDIAQGAVDDNLNGRVDLCEYARGDLDLSGEVDVQYRMIA